MEEENEYQAIIDAPEEFANSVSIEDLKRLVNFFNDLYHNEGNSGIPDETFDALVWVLKKRSPKGNGNSFGIGSAPRERCRDQLPLFVPSLNKIKIGRSLVDFLKSGKTNKISASVKLDGVSGIIEYQDGIPANVYLRGNGVAGSNISHVLDFIDVPQIRAYGNIIVRGEFVMKREVWQKKYSTDPRCGNYATSRNFVCGKLNAGTSSSVLQDIDFVAYDIMHISPESEKQDIPNGNWEDEEAEKKTKYTGDDLPPHSESLEILENEGFNIVTHKLSSNFLVTDIISWYTDQREYCPYPIDGVVLVIDEPRKVPNELENPQNAVAFKMDMEEQMRITKVVAVHWQASCYGLLIPVIEYKPVFIEGRRLRRATGLNAKRCINEWKIAPGCSVRVTASGGVIPRIVEVLEDAFSIGETPLEPPKERGWKWEGCNIVLLDPDNDPEVKLKRLVKFFTVVGIPGIREGMLTRMISGGLDNLQDILNATKARFQQIPGIGPKLSEKYRTGIDEIIPKAKLYRLMYASGCFPRGMGKGTLRLIAINIPTFLIEPDHILFPRLRSIYGIGPKKTEQFMVGLAKFRIFVKNFPTVLENNKAYFEDLAKHGFNPNISGKKFVFTNVKDDDLEDMIYDHQGMLEKAVSPETSLVVTGNPLEITTKIKDAQKLGIRVYTIIEFKDIIGQRTNDAYSYSMSDE
jgi:NAD-dependent DNA ligase